MIDTKQKLRQEIARLKPKNRGGELLANEKGQKVGGRKKGTPNFFTRKVKEAILASGQTAGDIVCSKKFTDKQLKLFPGLKTLHQYGGLHGYLVHLAVFKPEAYAPLLGKVVPIQMQAKEEEQRPVVYRSFKEIQEDLRAQGLLVDLKASEYECSEND